MKLITSLLCLALGVSVTSCGSSSSDSSESDEPPPKVSAESEAAAKAAEDAAEQARANEVRIMENAKTEPQPPPGTPGTISVPADINAIDEQIKKEMQ